MKYFFVILFVILPWAAFADFQESLWLRYKDVLGVQKDYLEKLDSWGDQFIKVPLDDEILANTKRNLSDIRIISGSGEEIPYKILVEKEGFQLAYSEARILNNSYTEDVAQSKSRAIVDIGTGGQIVNQLRLKSQSKNFQRNVKISGSNDQNTWNVLRDDAYIYNYSDMKAGFVSEDLILRFPDTTFRYLLVEIENNDETPVLVTRIDVLYEKSMFAREVSRAPSFDMTENVRTQSTEIDVDFSFAGMPTDRVEITTESENFYRNVFIFSTNDPENFRLLGRDSIFRYRTDRFTGEKLTVSFPETTDRFLKVVIENNDNTAIFISSLRTFANYRELTFQAREGETYRIYYGNEGARFPEYDLGKYFKYFNVESAPLATLSEQMQNTAYSPEKPPLTERVPNLFSFVVFFASLIMLYLLYRFMKQSPQVSTARDSRSESLLDDAENGHTVEDSTDPNKHGT